MSQTLPGPYSNLLLYIPDILLDNYLQNPTLINASPQIYPFRALLLRTNLQHFSQVTQHFLSKYHNGLEIIANLHKKYVDILQQYIGPTGGDMLKYTTDQLLFSWSLPNDNGEEYIADLCRVVIHQILKLQEALTNELQYDSFAVSVNFVLTIGNISIILLGGQSDNYESPLTSVEYIYSGQSFLETLEDQEIESDEMCIFVNNAIAEKISQSFYLEETRLHMHDLSERRNSNEEKQKFSRFFIVTGPKEVFSQTPDIDPLYFKSEVTEDQFYKVKGILVKHIPELILPHVLSNTENCSSEIRQVTSVFVNVPIDLNHLSFEAEIRRLQFTVQKIQNIARLYSATIYRVYIDKTGFNIFMIFGLYPQGDDQSSVRGVLSATLLVQSLETTDIPVYIGISTGQAVVSICGKYRKDLFIIGEPLYMSYLLSLVALKDGTKRILVDHETKLHTEWKVSLQTYTNSMLAEKIAQEVFEPVYNNGNLQGVPGNSFPEIRTHRFNVEYTKDITKQDYEDSIYMVGREDKLYKGRQLILQFVKTPIKMNILFITGSYGIGKSLFMRNLLENVEEMLKEKFSRSERPDILVSSLDPVKQRLKLNGWRGIFKEISGRLSRSLGINKEELLDFLFQKRQLGQRSKQLIMNIFGMIPEKGISDQAYGNYLETELDEEDERDVVEILTLVMQFYVGEKKLVVKGIEGQGFNEDMDGFPPVIICLDDLQYHDLLSWKVFAKIAERLHRVFIVGALREDDNETSPLFMGVKKENDIFSLNLQSIQNGNAYIDLLTQTEEFSTQRSKTERIKESIDVMKRIVPQLSNRSNIQFTSFQLTELADKEIEQLITRVLEGKYTSNELIRLVIQRSGKNPLIAVDILGTFLKQDLLQNVNGEWFPSEILRDLTKRGQFIEVLVPSSVYKKGVDMFDSLPFTHTNLLKLASIIGTTFDMRTLVLGNSLYHTLLPHKTLLSTLQSLIDQQVIQIIDGSSRNVMYKFCSSFLRETIYQLVPYSQRKAQHLIIATSTLGSSDSLHNEQNDYHWALSETGLEQDSSNLKAKREFVINQLNNGVSQQNKRGIQVFKADQLQKKSDKSERITSRYVVITKNALKYYKSESEFREKPVFETGSIPLKDIIVVVRFFILSFSFFSFLETTQ